MKLKKYDVLVIGGGIAGYYSARALGRAGKSVALVEKDKLGGTGLRWGALPVKKILDSFKSGGIGGEELLSNWDKDLGILNQRIEDSLMESNVHIYYGDGEFQDKDSFLLGGELLEADYFIIGTGTSPASIDEIPLDGERIISHKDVVGLKNLPKSVIILGGNVEGIELAALYAELGVEVTVVEMEKDILMDYDRDLIEPLEEYLFSKGVRILRGLGAKSREILKDGVKISLSNGENIKAEKAVLTFMRSPNIPKGIERTRVKVDKDKIIVGENLLTDEKNIFAIGDINGILGMSHVAIQQGLMVADYILKGRTFDLSYEILPRAIFTIPELSGVGKQEGELGKEGIAYKVGKHNFKDTWRGWAKNIDSGFVKVILSEDNTLLGIWMLGESVSEYIGYLGILIKNKTTVEDILDSLVIHPTLSEALLEAILDGKNGELIK